MRIYQTFITNLFSLYIFSGNINFYRKVVFDFENMGFLLWERRKEGKRDAVGKEREREREREKERKQNFRYAKILDPLSCDSWLFLKKETWIPLVNFLRNVMMGHKKFTRR